MKVIKNQRGFTLIELLAYILITIILVSIALPRYKTIKERSLAAQPLFWLKNSANVMRMYDLHKGNDAAFFALIHINPEAAYDELEMHNIPNPTQQSPDVPSVSTEHFHYYADDDGIAVRRISSNLYRASYKIQVDLWADRCNRRTINCTYYDDLGKKICAKLCPSGERTDYDKSCGIPENKCVITHFL